MEAPKLTKYYVVYKNEDSAAPSAPVQSIITTENFTITTLSDDDESQSSISNKRYRNLSPKSRAERIRLRNEADVLRRLNESPAKKEERLRRNREYAAQRRKTRSPKTHERQLEIRRQIDMQKKRAIGLNPKPRSSRSNNSQPKVSMSQDEASNSSSALSWISSGNVQLVDKSKSAARDANFCRFCLSKNGDKEIPKEFAKNYKCYFGDEYQRFQSFPKKVCTHCHNKAMELLTFLKTIRECQPEVKKILTELEQDENSEKEPLLDIVPGTSSNQSDPFRGQRDTINLPLKTECDDEDEITPYDPIESVECFDTMQNEIEIVDCDEILAKDNPLGEVEVFKFPLEPRPQELGNEEIFAQPSEPRKVRFRSKFNNRVPEGACLYYRKKRGTKTCDLCGFEYKKYRNIKTHIMNEHIKKNLPAGQPFMCNECPLTFASYWQRYKHKAAVHFDKSHFVCKQCDKQFPDAIELKKHQNYTHTPKVICTFCAELVNEGYMKMHIELKHATKDCKYCDEKFEGSQQQGVHKKRVHESARRVCPQCQDVVNNMVELRAHMKSVHGETTLPCPVEGCAFATLRQSLRAHMIYSHKNIDDSLKQKMIDENDLFIIARELK